MLRSEPVVTPAILLSDASIVEHGTSKRTVLGVFDQLGFREFPAPYPRFFITTWIGNIVGDLSEIALATRIQDKSGHVIFSGSAQVQFPAPTSFDGNSTIGFANAAENVRFPHPGNYSIVILLNGEEVGRRDFNVLLIQPPNS